MLLRSVLLRLKLLEHLVTVQVDGGCMAGQGSHWPGAAGCSAVHANPPSYSCDLLSGRQQRALHAVLHLQRLCSAGNLRAGSLQSWDKRSR
jgi:hypothetical protein